MGVHPSLVAKIALWGLLAPLLALWIVFHAVRDNSAQLRDRATVRSALSSKLRIRTVQRALQTQAT